MPDEWISVAQAALNIPTAVKNLKDLLSSPKPEPTLALESLVELKNQIVRFCACHHWLVEAKEHHDRLVLLSNQLEGVYREAIRSVAEGPFNPEAFSIARTRDRWLAARNDGLERALAFAEGIRHLSPAPLERDSRGDFRSGPTWARRFIELRIAIDADYARFDKGDLNVKPELFDRLCAIDSIVKDEMIRANEKIRRTAFDLALELNRLQGHMEAI
jgi:hypothetical protein